MNLTPTEAHQSEMRHAYYDGAPGILVSGLVWIAASVVCYQLEMDKAVWTLFIGGALIFPVSSLLEMILGRPGKTGTANALHQLGMASTIWLILGCAMSYGLFLFDPLLFFPAMMATIGCRYLVFATIFGRTVFWIFGGSLIAAAALVFYWAVPPAAAAGICGLIEVGFAFYVFSTASRPAA